MRRIVLHIGLPKTGSSAIQVFLLKNSVLLLRQAAQYYPEARRFVKWLSVGEGSNASFLWAYGTNAIGQGISKGSEEELERELARFKSYLEIAPPTVILSEEVVGDYHVRCSMPYWTAIREALDRACGSGSWTIDVIVYLRRQDDLLFSHWKQAVYAADPIGQSFSKWSASKVVSEGFDFRPMIQILEELFGREHVHPRIYGAQHFEGGDIAHDFCAVAGLDWNESFELPDTKVNPSISLDFAEALWRLTAIFGPDRSKRHFYRYAFLPSADERGAHLLDREQRLALLERYEESNRWIAQRYFGRDRLFDELGECRVYRSNPLFVGALLVSLVARSFLHNLRSKFSGR